MMGNDGRRRDLGLKRRINGRMVSARVVYLFARLVFLYKCFRSKPYVPFEPSTLVWILGDKQGQTLSHNFQWGELGKSDFHQPNWRNWRNSETRNHVIFRLSATTRMTTFLIEALSAQRECSARGSADRDILHHDAAAITGSMRARRMGGCSRRGSQRRSWGGKSAQAETLCGLDCGLGEWGVMAQVSNDVA